jgi:hypothetical protein
MDGESQLKVCECVLLCVYKCTRACEQHCLLTRNCATLFIRRREIWKLLPAHLPCVSRSLQAAAVVASAYLLRSQNMRRQQQSEKVQAARSASGSSACGRRQVAETQRFIKATHLIIITSILCPSPLGTLQDAFLILALNCLSTLLGPQFLERFLKQKPVRLNLHE